MTTTVANCRRLRLSEICDTTSGGTPSRSKPANFGGGIPWVKSGDLTDGDVWQVDETISQEGLDSSSAKLLPKGTLLLAMYGATVGKLGVLQMEAATNQAVCAIRTHERLDTKFLFYHLLAMRLRLIRMSVGGAQPNISQKIIRDLTIPMPTLSEQRHIVELLSRAENIVRMRREAEGRAKEIIPALFLDIFGDPASNERRWEVALFRDSGTLDRGRSRHRPRDAGHLYGGLYPFIQTGDVTRSGGAITAYSQTYSDAGLAQSKLWPIGTLCITIAANIAETGILQFDACFPDSVVGFLPGARVRTDYIQQWLGFLRPTLAAQAPQAAQKNINLAILGNLSVPIPPLALQEAFAERVGQARSVTASQKTATNGADQAFQSLLAGVFGEGA